jgi:LysR family nitrogen assimilation transcriptional regulator
VIKNAVLQGLGATIVPISAVASELKQGAVCAQAIEPPIRVAVALCTRKDALLDRATASVFRLAAVTAKELCANKSWVGGKIVDEINMHKG